MGNLLTFENILEKLDMQGERFIYDFKIWLNKELSKVEIKAIKNYYIEKAYIKLSNKDYDFKDLLQESFKGGEAQILEELRVIKWEAIAALANEYYNLMVNQYYISIEELSRFLNVEIQYSQLNIVEHIDRLSFPPTEIKQLMKREIFFKFKENTEFDLYMRSVFKDMLRKKTMLNLNTTWKYISEHMKQIEEYEVLNIKLSKVQLEQLQEKHKYLHIIKESFNKVAENIDITEADKIEYENKKDDKLLKFITDYFKINKSPNEFQFSNSIGGKSRFYSVSTMRVLFDKVYDVEVMRELNNVKYTKYNLYKEPNQKKPAVRYLIDIDFIKEVMQEVYNLKDVRKENKGYYIAVNVQVPAFKYYSIIKNMENIEEYFASESLKMTIKNNEEQ